MALDFKRWMEIGQGGGSFLKGQIAFIALLLASIAGARPILSPSPTTVSGTLKPCTIAIDGNVVSSSRSACPGLRLNGNRVVANSGKHAAFYLSVVADELRFDSSPENSPGEVPAKVVLPALTVAEAQKKSKLQVAGDTLFLDGRKMDLVNGAAVIDFAEGSEPLVLEVSKGGVTRIYTLAWETDAPVVAPAVAPPSELPPPPDPFPGTDSFGLGLPIGEWEFRPFVQFSFTRAGRSRFTWRAWLEVAPPIAGIIGRLALGGLFGYQLFRNGHSDTGQVWFELGLMGRAVAVDRYVYEIRQWKNGFRTAPPDNKPGLQAGFYWRSEPLRWEKWGLGLIFLADPINTQSQGSTGIWLELHRHLD